MIFNWHNWQVWTIPTQARARADLMNWRENQLNGTLARQQSDTAWPFAPNYVPLNVSALIACKCPRSTRRGYALSERSHRGNAKRTWSTDVAHFPLAPPSPNISDTKSGKRHHLSARLSWQQACDLGFRATRGEWERLMVAAPKR